MIMVDLSSEVADANAAPVEVAAAIPAISLPEAEATPLSGVASVSPHATRAVVAAQTSGGEASGGSN